MSLALAGAALLLLLVLAPEGARISAATFATCAPSWRSPPRRC